MADNEIVNIKSDPITNSKPQKVFYLYVYRFSCGNSIKCYRLSGWATIAKVSQTRSDLVTILLSKWRCSCFCAWLVWPLQPSSLPHHPPIQVSGPLLFASEYIYLIYLLNVLFIDHPGKCWIEDAKAAVAPGESYSKIGNCVSYNCHSDFSYQGEQCGVIGTQPPCKVSGVDNTKLWPECCPKIVC